MGLPARSQEAEDAFVDGWRGRGDDPGLVDAVHAAVDARRLALAARLVQLVDGDDAGDPVLARARRAAGLVLHQQLRPEDASWSELEDALRELHRERIARARLRQRLRADGRDDRVGRLDGRRRRR